MKYTQIATDAFDKLQLNAGILLTDFTPASGAFAKSDIIGATGGGTTFSVTQNFIDFGDGIDNVPANTMELKRLDYYEAVMSGTFKTMDTTLAAQLLAAADVDSVDTSKVVPRSDLLTTDFTDVWWVGDYSSVNDSGTSSTAGFIAIHMTNALSTGGFQLKSNDKDKGDFDFEFTAHYSIEDVDEVPFELYIKAGSSTAAGVTGNN